MSGGNQPVGDQNLTELDYSDCHKVVKSAFTRALNIFTSPSFESRDGWKLETEQGDAAVHSIRLDEDGRQLFSVRGILECSPEMAVSDSWDGLDGVASWNKNIDFSRRLLKVSDDFDIVHYGNAPILLVSARDYLIGRICREIDDVHYIVAHSIEGSDLPSPNGRVRATIHLGGGRYSAHPTDPNRTKIDFLLSLDYGGLFPSSIINSVLGRLFLKEFNENKKRSIVLRSMSKNA
ncbi:START domain-containing protein [Ditylenchus destructor]|nr:START domain-containing protein [Ditylenchus destructor]